ncbi:MAG: ATP-binding cassette domain-containing protein [Gammaproteobacteria bacterium]|nr:ATP-binding cassette domain-containing protein [Gammaproteobacteria bacterium]
MTETCIEFDTIWKSYGESPVIKGISLAVPRNVTTALVGESGSGKSTLLQIINGLVVPESGEVRLEGELLDYRNLPTLRRRMGYAVQGAGLFPHMTVQRNITLMAQLEAWPREKIDERYHYLLDLLELPAEFSDRYPHSLSGGRAAARQPVSRHDVESAAAATRRAISALDPITREGIHQEFIRIAQAESRSIILVTHDMAEAVKLAQHLVILKDGEVQQEGDIDAVRTHPDNDYVAQLFAGAGVE